MPFRRLKSLLLVAAAITFSFSVAHSAPMNLAPSTVYAELPAADGTQIINVNNRILSIGGGVRFGGVGRSSGNRRGIGSSSRRLQYIYGNRGGNQRRGGIRTGGSRAPIIGGSASYSQRSFSSDKFRSGNLRSNRGNAFPATGYSFGNQRRWFPNNFYSNRHFRSFGTGWSF